MDILELHRQLDEANAALIRSLNNLREAKALIFGTNENDQPENTQETTPPPYVSIQIRGNRLTATLKTHTPNHQTDSESETLDDL